MGPLPVAVRLAGPRIAAAAIACLLLSMWGIAVGTLVGWQASMSLMGLPSETFFMMMVKMIWFRDIVGLVVKGLLFGLLPAAICCHEALRTEFRDEAFTRRRRRAARRRRRPAGDPRLPGDLPGHRLDPDREHELVHAGLSRGPVLRPDAAEAPVPLKPPVGGFDGPGPREESMMSARFSAREIWVGLIVIVAIGGLIGLVGLASDGPGFLAPQKTIDVVFRDAQGLRVGSPVRIAGLDTGNVVDLDVVENVDGTLRAKVRISLPANLVKKLRQDVKVTVTPALTGMSHVNIVSSGHSNVPLVAGQIITGVETSFFDPIIEQLGLDPIERSDIRHMIGEVRQTVDSARAEAPPVPRLARGDLGQHARDDARRSGRPSSRPSARSRTSPSGSGPTRRGSNRPLVRVDEMTGELQGIVTENRENVRQTMASVRDLTASLTDVVSKDRVKVERVLDGLDVLRARSERVLYQADQIAGQIAGILVRGRTEIERAITNVRDATDWAKRLVQKIYANPFVLSPFYKPNHEDLRVEGAYDTALVFSHGAAGAAGCRQDARDATAAAPRTRSSSGRSRNCSSGS